MLEEEDEQLQPLVDAMTHPDKYQRPNLKKCITMLEEMLCL